MHYRRGHAYNELHLRSYFVEFPIEGRLLAPIERTPSRKTIASTFALYNVRAGVREERSLEPHIDILEQSNRRGVRAEARSAGLERRRRGPALRHVFRPARLRVLGGRSNERNIRKRRASDGPSARLGRRSFSVLESASTQPAHGRPETSRRQSGHDRPEHTNERSALRARAGEAERAGTG